MSHRLTRSTLRPNCLYPGQTAPTERGRNQKVCFHHSSIDDWSLLTFLFIFFLNKLWFVYQTEKVTARYGVTARYPREGTFTFKRGLSTDGPDQQPRQEFIWGASRQQELLWQLFGRHGGDTQNSVQVTGSPTSWVWVCLLISSTVSLLQRKNAALQWTQRVEWNGNYLLHWCLLSSHF